MKNHKFAKISDEFQRKGITWLRLIDKTKKGMGVYVFLYTSISEHCLYDHWFLKLEDALNYTEEDYGISREDWLTYEDFEKTRHQSNIRRINN